MTMFICIRQHEISFKCFEADFMKKLSNTKTEVKKSGVYKKSVQ